MKFKRLIAVSLFALICFSGCSFNYSETANDSSTENESSTTSEDTQSVTEEVETLVEVHYMVNGKEVSKEEYDRQKALDELELPEEIADKNDDIDNTYIYAEDLREADGSGKIIYHYSDGSTVIYEKSGDAVNITKEEVAKAD